MSSTLIARNGRWAAGLIAAVSICISLNCVLTPDMSPLSPSFSIFELNNVPLIVVGQAVEKCHPVGPVSESRWDGRPVQLWKVRIKIEQIVQGQMPDKSMDVFYFVDLGGSTGPWSHLVNIQAGHSEIFFLQKDGNRWRTICDGWRTCVLWVRTGTHYNYKLDRRLPVESLLTNLLLSRGDQTSDAQMIDAIYHPEGRLGWEGVFNRFQQLANEEKSPRVRSVLLERIDNFANYYGPLREPPKRH
jgi:hypothetical protein